MEHRIVSRKLGVLAAEGKGTIVTFDYGLQQKVPIPDDLRRRIDELEGTVARPNA